MAELATGSSLVVSVLDKIDESALYCQLKHLIEKLGVEQQPALAHNFLFVNTQLGVFIFVLAGESSASLLQPRLHQLPEDCTCSLTQGYCFVVGRGVSKYWNPMLSQHAAFY